MLFISRMIFKRALCGQVCLLQTSIRKTTGEFISQADTGSYGTFLIIPTLKQRLDKFTSKVGMWCQSDFTKVCPPVDYVFDTIGRETLLQSFEVVKPGGKVVSVAGLLDAKFAKAYGLNLIWQGLFKLASHKITRASHKAHAGYEFFFIRHTSWWPAVATLSWACSYWAVAG